VSLIFRQPEWYNKPHYDSEPFYSIDFMDNAIQIEKGNTPNLGEIRVAYNALE